MPAVAAGGGRQAHAPDAIRVLDADVAARIAAGEVIERPFSIVRELIDNALDAGASEIDVQLDSGGLGQIAVHDNGRGIARSELQRTGLRHATSKISNEHDLLHATTLGFRGEALASIAACARLDVVTRTRTATTAARLVADSRERRISAAAAAPGTRVQVTRLFADMPGRRRFLRRPGTETTLCRRMVLEKALAHPGVTLRLSVDGEADTTLTSAGLRDRVADVLGSPVMPDDLFEARRDYAEFQVAAIGARPELARRDRSRLMVFVNRRRIQQFGLVQALEYGYGAVVPGGRHPVACLFVEIAPHLVDFNVHPAKREARFRNLAPLHQAVVRLVQQAVVRFGHRSPLPAPQGQPESLPLRGHDGRALPGPARPPAVVADPPHPYVGEDPATGAGAGTVRSTGPAPDSAAHVATPGRLGVITPGPAAAADGIALPDRSAGIRYIGQSLGTFLLVEIGRTLYFVDQHAAHERVLYERLRRRSFAIQQLLLPIELDLEPEAADALHEARELLDGVGIVVELEKGRPRRITALAEPLHQLPARWLREYVAGMRGSGADLERAVLADVACKLAVKDGELLDHDAAAAIARESFTIDLQHCPHGRPLWYSVTRDQVSAQVGRQSSR
ncbi:MAG: DNA mismatch repair endonuclease MutL [Spirochaetaceae bacterium]|nr:DNA mismatch repair endonuclease MutL [Spirochaetaceae bacterium]MDE0449767.1 DNA mismatch repair endonuclease MutL [Spirochaetaceae bacterium]